MARVTEVMVAVVGKVVRLGKEEVMVGIEVAIMR